MKCTVCGCQNILAERKKPINGRHVPSYAILEYAQSLGIEADGHTLESLIKRIYEIEKKRSVKL